jgi:signal transduction histidine kinase
VDWWVTWAGLHMSLAFKLAAPVMVTTAILAVAMGTVVTDQVNRQIELAYAQQAASVADGVAVMFTLDPQNTVAVNDYLNRLMASQPELISVRIHGLDSRATVIASGNAAELGVGGLAEPDELRAILAGVAMQDENDGNFLTTIQPLRLGNQLFGAVAIRSSKAGQFAAIRALTFAIGIAALLSIVIESVFVLSVLYLGIMRRTKRIERAVEAVASGDTSIRLPEGSQPRGRDSIFNLVRSVDHMIVSLDDRRRGEILIRGLGQKALAGGSPAELISESMAATREALGLEQCTFAALNEDGSMADPAGTTLPVWVVAMAEVAITSRKVVLTDRFGDESRLADDPSTDRPAQAAIVPLPRTTKAGHAIVAIAPDGRTIPDSGLAVLDAVAATIAESLHMHAAEAARAESAVKSKVMSAVSHEMRNPLNSIIGFTGLVLSDSHGNLSEKQRRQLGHVRTSAGNLLNLVNNYLEISRLRGGPLTVQYETARISPIVSDVVEAMRQAAESKHITVQIAVSDELEARVDPTRLRQILTNLLSNAIKFTPPNGRTFIRVRNGGDHLRIAVSDTGVGVARADQKLLFTEFAKIDAGSMAAGKGAGLGLALTNAFVTAMHGTVTVHSRQGRGATFVVRLPLKGEPVARASAA